MDKQKEIITICVRLKIGLGCIFLLVGFIYGSTAKSILYLIPILADFFVVYLLKKNKIKSAAYIELASTIATIFFVNAGFKSESGINLYYLPLIFGAYLFDATGPIRVKYYIFAGAVLSMLMLNYFEFSPQIIHGIPEQVMDTKFVFYLNLLLILFSSIYILNSFVKLRKEAFDALQSNQGNFAALIENTTDQIWSVDTNFNLIIYNAAYKRVYSQMFNSEPIAGENVLNITIDSPLFEEWKTYYERAFKGESFLIDEKYNYPDGIRYFEFSFHPVYKNNMIAGASIRSKDVSETKQQLIDEKLHSENLQLLLNSTEDIIFEFDVNGKCSRVWYAENFELFDPVDHLKGKNIKELFDIPFNTNIAPAYDEVAKTGIPQRFEYSYNRFGKTIHSVVKLRRIKNSSPPRVSIVLEDVTQQKVAEIKQDQQSLFLNKLIDHLPLGLFVKSVKNNLSYTLWNKELESLFELKQDEVLGRTDQEIFQHVGEIENYLATDKMVLESKEPLLIEKLNISAGLKQVIARTFKIPILDAKGEVELIIGILENITDVVKAQQKLEMAEKRWNYALSGSRDAVWDINLITNESFFSPIFNGMLGYADSEPVKNDWEEMVHPDDLADSWQKFTRHIAGETPYYESEYRFRKKDNTYIWVLDRGKVAEFDDKGIATRIIGTFSDITYRKNLEQQYLLALQKAEESSKAKSLFLSTMSHEIRTPMNGVIGIINLLQHENPKPEQIENLNALKYSADQLMFLLNDILDFSKIDADKLIIEESSFSLIKLLQNSLKPLVPFAKQKGLSLKLNISNDMPLAVLSDPLRLGQIFSNLLSNAIKFTAAGSILVEAVVKDITKENANVQFSFTDSGIGIDKDYLPHIFEEFTQASSDTTRKYGGTGLGLAIAKRLVAKLGGNLQVESTRENGSRFWFTLGLIIDHSQIEMSSRADDIGNKKQLTGMKLLLVEDNKMNIYVAQKFLFRWGIEMDTAHNGNEALECVQAKKYDLILMDLQMPEMDGIEAAKKMRSKGIKTPIYALTANVLSDVKQKVIESGMDDYISKPFNPDELYVKISKHYAPVKIKSETLNLFS